MTGAVPCLPLFRRRTTGRGARAVVPALMPEINLRTVPPPGAPGAVAGGARPFFSTAPISRRRLGADYAFAVGSMLARPATSTSPRAGPAVRGPVRRDSSPGSSAPHSSGNCCPGKERASGSPRSTAPGHERRPSSSASCSPTPVPGGLAPAEGEPGRRARARRLPVDSRRAGLPPAPPRERPGESRGGGDDDRRGAARARRARHRRAAGPPASQYVPMPPADAATFPGTAGFRDRLLDRNRPAAASRWSHTECAPLRTSGALHSGTSRDRLRATWPPRGSLRPSGERVRSSRGTCPSCRRRIRGPGP